MIKIEFKFKPSFKVQQKAFESYLPKPYAKVLSKIVDFRDELNGVFIPPNKVVIYLRSLNKRGKSFISILINAISHELFHKFVFDEIKSSKKIKIKSLKAFRKFKILEEDIIRKIIPENL